PLTDGALGAIIEKIYLKTEEE
ncbi:MAG: hypothetical protein K0R75_2527, partial [Paenibacillaceae bacterium]|nr:hypothetical protein [Paenibacillaceae bacterium]